MLILLASQVSPLRASHGITFIEEPLWMNACSGGNGLQHSSQEDSNSSKQAARNSIRTSIENIRVVLNVNNMYNKSKDIAEDWSLHTKYYNFLKANATVSIKEIPFCHILNMILRMNKSELCGALRNFILFQLLIFGIWMNKLPAYYFGKSWIYFTDQGRIEREWKALDKS